MPHLNLGLDAVGPRQKCGTQGPNDVEPKPDSDGLAQCEGCLRMCMQGTYLNIWEYGTWCTDCLDKRLKVER